MVQQQQAGEPWEGYFYRLLSKRGPNAAGGEFSYLGAKSDMLGGWAIVAWPAQYRVSGVMTFVVNRDGRVFRKDLGEKTADAAAAIQSFDPDASWTFEDDSDTPPTAAPAGK
jgi:hypothetical protein